MECTSFCRGHIDESISLSESAKPLEKALINALSQCVQEAHIVSEVEFGSWDDAYATAMRQVNVDFPDNQDVMALFVESMMACTPWNMWDVKTCLPPKGVDTYEAISVCEYAIELADQHDKKQHPAILHLHIHLIEMSTEPENAIESANRLVGLCPDAGYIHHMPGHIYILCEEYVKAKIASEAAIRVNLKYLSYAGPGSVANKGHSIQCS